MSDLEAGTDKAALELQEVDTSENQELNLTVTETGDQLPMQACGDHTEAIASVIAEALLIYFVTTVERNHTTE